MITKLNRCSLKRVLQAIWELTPLWDSTKVFKETYKLTLEKWNTASPLTERLKVFQLKLFFTFLTMHILPTYLLLAIMSCTNVY